MKFDLLIKGGDVVSGSGKARADVGVKDGKISILASDLDPGDAREVVDASGKLVMPGALDVHVHLELPFCGTVSADDFANGTKAGAMGGVTTLIDFAIQSKGQTLLQAIEARRRQADPKVCIDYGLHAGITQWNEERAAEIPEVIRSGVPTFKMFMIYRSEGWQSTDADLFAALRATAPLGGMIGVHAENDDLLNFLIAEAVRADRKGAHVHGETRPAFTESEAIGRAIQMAEATGGRLYIFHMTTAMGTAKVIEARRRDIKIHAETCAQYLTLTDDVFFRPDGHHFATCPPLRKREDLEALWKGLAAEEVEVVSTDTCTFTSQQKAMWQGDFRRIPFGMPGVETLLPLMYSKGVGEGRLDLPAMVRLLCENPARLFGLFPRKGIIAVGSDADMVIFDPEFSFTITPENLATNCDYSPYEGTVVKGMPIHTLVRGNFVMRDRTFVGQQGQGCYLERQPLEAL